MRAPALLSLLGIIGIASAQWDRQPYCDMGRKPNVGGCLDIKDHGVSDKESYEDDKWSSGNCMVDLKRPLGRFSVVSGKDLKWAIQTIMDTCDTGFMFINSVRIDVGLCTVGRGGVEQECSSPLLKVEKREADKPTTGLHARREAEKSKTSPNPSHLLPRLLGIPVDMLRECQMSGASAIDDCKSVAQKIIDAKSISLPYREVEEGCEVQIWPVKRDYVTARGDYIGNEIISLADQCADANKKYIGFVQERAGPILGLNYHVFFGRFCGRFSGASDPDCTH
jgi:hypothetical protein